MYEFTFVVLHYNNHVDTIECVNSLLTLNYENYSIVIIDNGSQNSSGEIINEKYKRCSNVKTIICENNLGFARGNNLGYNFAKKELEADFIIIINSDTIIEQKDFLSRLVDIYNETSFGVLGPDIISTKNGFHQNPQRNEGITIDELNKHIAYLKKMKLFMDAIYYTKSYEIIKRVRTIFRKKTMTSKKSIIKTNNHNIRQKNIQLHGSCLIFSPKFIERQTDAFCPETFLYMEEDLLFHKCMKDGISTLYDPSLFIYHKEDGSTDLLFDSSMQKHRFIFKHAIDSAIILRTYLQNSDSK